MRVISFACQVLNYGTFTTNGFLIFNVKTAPPMLSVMGSNWLLHNSIHVQVIP